MIRPNAPVTALLLSLALVACAKKPPKELPPQPGDVSQQTTDNTGAGDGTQVLPGSQADFVASVTADTIYFDTDRYNVDAADGTTLQSQAQWLARYPAKRITLEGHADEQIGRAHV